jgi:hypothetical protein
MRLFSILLLLLVGCGEKGLYEPKMDQEIRPHFDEFLDVAKRNDKFVLPYNITFEYTSETIQGNKSIVGLCINLLVDHLVLIKTQYWSKATQNKQRQLIFHELGHCMLNRHHTTTYLEDGCPSSIMHAYVVSQPCVDKHADYYDQELFNEPKP